MKWDKQIKAWARMCDNENGKFLKESEEIDDKFRVDEYGNIECFKMKLTSLKGAPQEVDGSFRCQWNKLTSLEGAPQKVGASFDCSFNKLTTLEGAPQKVGGDFNCAFCGLSEEQIAEYEEFLKNPKPQQIVDGHFHSLLGQPSESRCPNTPNGKQELNTVKENMVWDKKSTSNFNLDDENEIKTIKLLIFAIEKYTGWECVRDVETSGEFEISYLKERPDTCFIQCSEGPESEFWKKVEQFIEDNTTGDYGETEPKELDGDGSGIWAVPITLT